MPPRAPPLPPLHGVAPRTPVRAVPAGDDYPPPAFHFAVSFGTATRDADCSFREVSGIGPEMETETVVEGSENRYVYQLLKAVKHPRRVLKRGVAAFNGLADFRHLQSGRELHFPPLE